MSETPANVRRGSSVRLLCNLMSAALVAYLIATAAGRFYFTTAAGESTLLSTGDYLRVPGITGASGERTLVLALQMGCRACEDSAPFYQALLGYATSGVWGAVVLVPEPIDAGQKYAESLGLTKARVVHADLLALGVVSTPTAILVDSKGRVLQQWVGALSARDEDDVADHLGLAAWKDRGARALGDEPGAATATRQEVMQSLQAGAVNLLDVRERAAFRYGHVHGALNIPADELDVRAAHELREGVPTLVYCRYSPGCVARGEASLCERTRRALDSAGVRNVSVIRDRLALLAESGVSIDGSPDM